MAQYRSRLFAGEDDLRLLVEFTLNATAARWPRWSYWHAGDIVWQLAPLLHTEPVLDVNLWFDDHGLAGYVVFESPLIFEFDVRAGIALNGTLLESILLWSEDRRRQLMQSGDKDTPGAYAMLGAETLATSALDSDVERIATLERHGYVSNDRHDVCYALRVNVDVPDCRLPPGTDRPPRDRRGRGGAGGLAPRCLVGWCPGSSRATVGA